MPRGTLTEPGKNSPYRDRTRGENLDLFRRMKAGEFPDGARVLRAKIDMASANMNLRDPVLYRILHASTSAHRRQVVDLPDLRLRARPDRCHRGHHPLDLHAGIRGPSPALRLVLDHLPELPGARRSSIEFARLNLTYTVMSKRNLLRWCKEATSMAGTIRACRRSRDAPPRRTRPRRSASSAKRSASPSSTAWSTSGCSRSPPRGRSTSAPRAYGGAAAAQGGDRELPGGAERAA